MGFNFGEYYIDRLLYGILRDKNTGDFLGRLNNISEATIDVTATSEEVRDGRGVLIDTVYTAKDVAVTATNAILSMDGLALMSGSDKVVATSENKIVLPYFETIVGGTDSPIQLKHKPIAGTFTISKEYKGKGLDTITKYKPNTAASANEYLLAEDKLTLPTGSTASDVFFVGYDYEAEDGVLVNQYADKFPKAMQLNLVGLAKGLCGGEELTPLGIIMPSFKPSPEVSQSFSTTSTFEFKGNAQLDWCGNDKILYKTYVIPE